jgi:hypothetical protein
MSVPREGLHVLEKPEMKGVGNWEAVLEVKMCSGRTTNWT